MSCDLISVGIIFGFIIIVALYVSHREGKSWWRNFK